MINVVALSYHNILESKKKVPNNRRSTSISCIVSMAEIQKSMRSRGEMLQVSKTGARENGAKGT